MDRLTKYSKAVNSLLFYSESSIFFSFLSRIGGCAHVQRINLYTGFLKIFVNAKFLSTKFLSFIKTGLITLLLFFFNVTTFL